MSQSLRLALAGATGLVGTAIRERLAESETQPSELLLLASSESAGQRLEYRGRYLVVTDLAEFDFHKADLVVFAVPLAVVATQAQRAVEAGCRVVDLSGHFLTDLNVPLLCPSVNPVGRAPVAALPGAIAMQVASLLAAPVADELLAGVDLVALLPAALAGRAGMDELAGQTAALLNVQTPATDVFMERLAFQLLSVGAQPQGSSHQAQTQGAVLALKRLFGLSLPVSCQAFWVPVFHGLTVAVTLSFNEEVDEGRVQQWLEDAGVNLLEMSGRQAQPVLPDEPGAGIHACLQQNMTGNANQLRLWLVADSVQLAAFMSVQTVEVLIKDHLY